MEILAEGRGPHPNFDQRIEVLDTNKHVFMCLTCWKRSEYLFQDEAWKVGMAHKKEKPAHRVTVTEHARIPLKRRRWRVLMKPVR